MTIKENKIAFKAATAKLVSYTNSHLRERLPIQALKRTSRSRGHLFFARSRQRLGGRLVPAQTKAGRFALHAKAKVAENKWLAFAR